MGAWLGQERCYASGNSVSILWVSGHSEVKENEKADRLTNRGIKDIGVTCCNVGLLEPECYLEELLEKGLEKMMLKK